MACQLLLVACVRDFASLRATRNRIVDRHAVHAVVVPVAYALIARPATLEARSAAA
jgi:hypothetical protein